MRGYIGRLAASILAALAGWLAAATASAAAEFHSPQTVAERTLDQMLQWADADGEQLDNLFHRFGPVPTAERVDYRRILSARLLRAMRTEQHRQVQADCGGTYLSDSICGLDYSPITCSQDSGSAYLYRTISMAADSATIEFKWPEEGMVVATYRLRRFAGVWKIDGVACYQGARFNFR